MQRKFIIGGLLVLALLWAGNLYYFQKHSVPRPLFLQHYYDLPLYGDSSIELYYLIDNQYADKTVALRLPGAPDALQFRTMETKVNVYGMHTLKKVTIELSPKKQTELAIQKELRFSELLVHFSGIETLEKIGLIRIDLQPKQTRGISPLHGGRASSVEGSRNFEAYLLDKPLVLQKINVYTLEMTQTEATRFAVQINEQGWKDIKEFNEHILPMNLEAGQRWQIESSVQSKPGNLINLRTELEFQQSDGSLIGSSLYFSSDPPYFEKDVLNIIREAKR